MSSTTNPSPCLQAALAYAELQWSVIPVCPPDHAGVTKTHLSLCSSLGKTPLGSWKPAQAQRATPQQIEAHWKAHPTANVGVALGRVSGIVGIDIDGPAGEECFAEIIGDTPIDTCEFTTPGGGRRLLFALPPNVEVPITHQHSGKHSGLSLLGQGSQTVMPPSVHANGGRYKWKQHASPFDRPPQVLPSCLLKWALDSHAPKPELTEQANASDIFEGARDSTLTSLAGTMRRRGFSPEAIFDALKVENHKRCQPPLPEPQVRKIADSVARYPPADAVCPNRQKPGKGYTGDELLTMTFADPKFAVPSLVPQGLVILASKPKLGKSWLMLGVGIAVATGNKALGKILVPAGDVLYLALEDRPRRLQTRLKKMLTKMPDQSLTRLTTFTEWPRMHQGGLEAIEAWLKQHPEARLVVIDTWGRFRPPKAKGADAYQEDYEQGAGLKALADECDVCIVIVHHCRKTEGEDPFDAISGTLGLTGSVDASLVLKRERGRQDATLFVTGRDIDDQELALRWDTDHAAWSILGNAEEYRLSKQRARILEVLSKSEKPLGPKEIAEDLDEPQSRIKKLLRDMANDGQVNNPDHGKYTTADKH
jgi:Bifunctional DNA primase/polymerase, N-terminal/AAA domain/Primase C terminal 1 (PriCT-1)